MTILCCKHGCQLSVAVSVVGRDTFPEVGGDIGRSQRPEGEGATLGREDAEPTEREERQIVGRTERADETEAERVGT